MFVCRELEGEISPNGTAFLIGLPAADGGFATYFVTARHVVAHGQPTYVRLRRTDNGPPEDKLLGEWVPHPTADVAMTPCEVVRDEFIASYQRLDGSAEHPYGHYLPSVGQRAHFVGLLADVSTMVERAVPMMRSAMIGALYAEDIPMGGNPLRYERQAHLIDTYSRSGFSGSPVYADYSYIKRKPISTPGLSGGVMTVPDLASESALLGVLSGHFGGDRNAGVAIVVPMEAVWELLQNPRLVEWRNREAARMAKRRKDDELEGAAVYDSIEPTPPTDDDQRVSLDGVDPEDALRALLRTPSHGQTQDPA